MNALIDIANKLVIYSVFCTIFFLVYGYVFYSIGKFIVKISAVIYRKVKDDWENWRSNKKSQ